MNKLAEFVFVGVVMLLMVITFLPCMTAFYNPHLSFYDCCRLWHAKLTFYF